MALKKLPQTLETSIDNLKERYLKWINGSAQPDDISKDKVFFKNVVADENNNLIETHLTVFNNGRTKPHISLYWYNPKTGKKESLGVKIDLNLYEFYKQNVDRPLKNFQNLLKSDINIRKQWKTWNNKIINLERTFNKKGIGNSFDTLFEGWDVKNFVQHLNNVKNTLGLDIEDLKLLREIGGLGLGWLDYNQNKIISIAGKIGSKILIPATIIYYSYDLYQHYKEEENILIAGMETYVDFIDDSTLGLVSTLYDYAEPYIDPITDFLMDSIF